MTNLWRTIDEAPDDLALEIRHYSDWDHDAAASIAYLESGWDRFAERDTRDSDHPCGAVLSRIGGVIVTAEWSISYFQINACNLPSDWRPEQLWNTFHNVGTAHLFWTQRGWYPWLFSAQKLGLI